MFSVSSHSNTKTCTTLPVLNDNILEGDEDLYLCLSGDDVTVVEGAETLQVIIEDDEGIIGWISVHHYPLEKSRRKHCILEHTPQSML